jgi:hypothetical protein
LVPRTAATASELPDAYFHYGGADGIVIIATRTAGAASIVNPHQHVPILTHGALSTSATGTICVAVTPGITLTGCTSTTGEVGSVRPRPAATA